MHKRAKVDQRGLASLELNNSQETEELGSKAADSKSLQPCIITHDSSGGDNYVVDLAYSNTASLLAAASSKQGVSVFDAASSGHSLLGRHSEHKGAVSAVTFDSGSGSLLFSCGVDGDVIAWDPRSQQTALRCTVKIKDQRQELNCLDVAGGRIAAGSNGLVTFWDARQPQQQLASFDDIHEQQVTQVAFSSGTHDTFLSASEDGLISVFDLSSTLDEDDSFQAAVNLMDSITKFGFYGPDSKQLWCTTATENLYFWDWAAACSEGEPGGEGPSATLSDPRKKMSQRAKAAGLDDSISYLVGCLDSDSSGDVTLLATTDDGNAACFPVRLKQGACKIRDPCHILQGGHSSVVRCCVSGSSISQLYTAAEDGRVVLWTPETAVPTANNKRKGQ